MTLNSNQQKVAETECATASKIPDWVFTSQQPIVLKGLVKDWPLTKLGHDSPHPQIQYLREQYQGQPSYVYFSEETQNRLMAFNDDVSELNFTIKNTTLHQLFDDLEAVANAPDTLAPIRYIASNVVDYYFPNLRQQNDLNFCSDHFALNPLQGGDPLVGVWIGNQAITACHYDAQDNIVCCVAGQRKFTLFPPSQIENLYPGPLHLNPGGQAITMVDFDQPDFARFPKFEQALKHKQEVVLEPGDGLFIPSMWWHQVASLSPFNLMINYWWNSFPKSHGQAMTALEHALLSIRGRPKAEREAWRSIFDYYVFADAELAVEHIPDHAHGPLDLSNDTTLRQLRAQLLNKLNC